MENITYIIPIHKWDQIVEEYLEDAVTSASQQIYTDGDRIMLVGPKSVIDSAENICKTYAPKYIVQKVENDDTDFFVQINKAVFACVTPFFTILEFDDTFCKYWNEVMQKYASKSAFLIPVNLLMKENKPYTLANELALSSSFAGDEGIGVIDVEALKNYVEFNLTGGLFKTEDFIAIGGLKPSLKFTAWYEFMLRAAYQNKPIFVVPKMAYKHTINRPNSFMETINDTVQENEAEWLIKAAMQEYFFKEDRHKTYQQEKGGDAK